MLTARFILRLRAYHSRHVGDHSADSALPQISTVVVATVDDGPNVSSILDEFDVDAPRLSSHELRETVQESHTVTEAGSSFTRVSESRAWESHIGGTDEERDPSEVV